MNLYLVTCAKRNAFGDDHYKVYVISQNSTGAEEKALSAMRILGYKYTDWVENVELLASVNTYRAKHILVM